jgi:hypothetical protein
LLFRTPTATPSYAWGCASAGADTLPCCSNVSRRNTYDALTRIAVNLKRLLAKVPGGESQIASLLAAMYLWREDKEKLDQKLIERVPKNPIKHYLAKRSAVLTTSSATKKKEPINRGI